MIRRILIFLEGLFRKVFRSFYGRALFLLKRRVLHRGKELKNKFAGERCFLIANGASVNDVDLDLLKNEKLVACNLLFKHPHFKEYSWFAYVSAESGKSLFLPKDNFYHKSKIYPLIEKEVSDPATLMFFSLNQHSFFTKAKLFANRKLYFLKTLSPMMETKKLSNDISGNFTFLDGVGYSMIGIAIYLGFKEIYLCGYDYTLSPMRIGHFYENWTDLKVEAVDARHAKVKSFAEAAGVKIFNLTPAGFESPVYEKFDITDLPKLVSRETK